MHWFKTLTALAVLGLPAPSGHLAPDPPFPPVPFYAGGTQVHELDHDRWVDTLHEVGLNTVAVTVYAKQGAWDSDHFWYESEEPAVLDEIRRAKARGLSVVLVLRVAIDHAFPENKFVWHGMIMPRNQELIRSWFEQYTGFVLKWADVAQAEGVDVLGIGSEMKSLSATLPLSRYGNLKNYHGHAWYQRMQRRRAYRFADEIKKRHLWVRGYRNYETLEAYLDARYEHQIAWARQAYLRDDPSPLKRVNRRRRQIDALWVELIRRTRTVYDGKLTYAANFDNYHNVGFWRHLDLMGINAYFQLRPNLSAITDPQRRLPEFADRWESILGRIHDFKRDQGLTGMPFLFTELGYTFRRHSTVEPWAHGGFSVVGWKGNRQQLVVWNEEPVDYEERRAALESLAVAHRRMRSDLTGILYWKLSTDRKHEAIEPYVVHIGPSSRDRVQSVLVDLGSSGATGS